MSLADKDRLIRDLIGKLERLSPCRHDPERFHVDKSEIRSGLRQLLSEGRP